MNAKTATILQRYRFVRDPQGGAYDVRRRGPGGLPGGTVGRVSKDDDGNTWTATIGTFTGHGVSRADAVADALANSDG